MRNFKHKTHHASAYLLFKELYNEADKNHQHPILITPTPQSEKMKTGDDGTRTHDFRLAKPALSQLSYVPGYPFF